MTMMTMMLGGGPVIDLTDDGNYPLATSPLDAVAYGELPVFGVPPPDKKWILDAIVNQLDQGQFIGASQLADSMMRDDAIVGALEQRHAALFGAGLELQPGKDTAKGRKVRDQILEGWDEMFPRDELEEMATYGFLCGIGIEQLIWDTARKDWTFRISGFHPRFYLWRWDLRSYQVITLDGGLATVPQSSVQWLAHTPYGYKRAFLRGRLRALCDPWMMRGWTKNDWAHWLEIHGKPIRKAIIPQQAKPAEEREFVRSIGNMGNNTVIKTRQDKDGNKYDVELLEAMSQGWDGFEAMLGWTERAISRVAHGQSDSAGKSSGEGNTLSRPSNPGQVVAQNVCQALNSSVSLSIKQALRYYCEFVHGDPGLAPTWSREKRSGFWLVEPPEDTAARAKVNLTQAQADQTNITAGVYSPATAAKRYDGGAMSLDTEIDPADKPKTMQEMRDDAEAMKTLTAKPPGDNVGKPGNNPVDEKGSTDE